MRGHFLRAAQKGDANALAYIAAVETADGQALEGDVKTAINAFVVGCKTDGIWNAIHASCILAGARTLAGALVPLVGTAPTNLNFTNSDYNRKTGLKGNGSTKYLNSNQNTNANAQNNFHMCIYKTTAIDGNGAYVGQVVGSSAYDFIHKNPNAFATARTSDAMTLPNVNLPGFFGVSRSSASTMIGRSSSTDVTRSTASFAPDNANLFVFARNQGSSASFYSNAQLSFYSIGSSINLALLDARVTTLMAAFAAAIP